MLNKSRLGLYFNSAIVILSGGNSGAFVSVSLIFLALRTFTDTLKRGISFDLLQESTLLVPFELPNKIVLQYEKA